MTAFKDFDKICEEEVNRMGYFTKHQDCIEKQKVRNAIDKIKYKIEDFLEDKSYNRALYDLKKELGL